MLPIGGPTIPPLPMPPIPPIPDGGPTCLNRCGSPNRSSAGRFIGGLRLKRLLGKTMLTFTNAPSSCASCICAIALSACDGCVKRIYAIPLFIINCGFIGISSSVMVPYVLKISRKCASWTFLVSFSMTILALFGSAGGEGLREWLGERV